MRSDLVFHALGNVSNRYTLCQLAAKASRKLHKPHTRVQNTINNTLARLAHASELDVEVCGCTRFGLVSARRRSAVEGIGHQEDRSAISWKRSCDNTPSSVRRQGKAPREFAA